MTTDSLSYQLGWVGFGLGVASQGEIMVVEWQIGELSRAEIAIFGFGFFCFDSENVILRVWVWVFLLRS